MWSKLWVFGLCVLVVARVVFEDNVLLQATEFQTKLEFGAGIDGNNLLEKKQVQKGSCLDGNKPAYYYGKGTNNSTVWVLHLEGGGGCNTKASCGKWIKQPQRNSNNSTTWPNHAAPFDSEKNVKDLKNMMMSADKNENPKFYEAHHVYVPYCTGDFHMGYSEEATKWGLKFEGQRNLQFILEDLQNEQPDFEQMTKFLLTGESAGGLGTFSNCDWMHEVLTTKLERKLETFKCAPIDGWFSPGYADDTHRDPEKQPLPLDAWKRDREDLPEIEPEEEEEDQRKLYVPKECLDVTDDATKCGTPALAYSHIQQPIFVIQTIFDSNQLNSKGYKCAENQTEFEEYTEYFGKAIKKSLKKVVGKQPAFIASCYGHVGQIRFGGDTRVDEIGSLEAVAEWFFNDNPAHYEDRRGPLPTNRADHCKLKSLEVLWESLEEKEEKCR